MSLDLSCYEEEIEIACKSLNIAWCRCHSGNGFDSKNPLWEIGVGRMGMTFRELSIVMLNLNATIGTLMIGQSKGARVMPSYHK